MNNYYKYAIPKRTDIFSTSLYLMNYILIIIYLLIIIIVWYIVYF